MDTRTDRLALDAVENYERAMTASRAVGDTVELSEEWHLAIANALGAWREAEQSAHAFRKSRKTDAGYTLIRLAVTDATPDPDHNVHAFRGEFGATRVAVCGAQVADGYTVLETPRDIRAASPELCMTCARWAR